MTATTLPGQWSVFYSVYKTTESVTQCPKRLFSFWTKLSKKKRELPREMDR